MTPTALLLAFCGFLVAGADSSESTPTISHISADQTVNIGETVQFDCTVNNAQDYAVLWVKVDPSDPLNVLFISTNNFIVTRDARYHVRIDSENSSYNLQIKDVKDTDHGTYRCVVQLTPTTKVSAEVKLLVLAPPSFLPNSTSSTLTVSEGVPVRLQCYAEGYPPPQITWRRENNVAFYSGDTIIRGNVIDIQNITKDDRGLYFCVADNGAGKRIKYSVEVNVKFAPIINAPRPRVGQALHYNADLDCNVESYPLSAIYWHKNGTVLFESLKYTTSAFSTPSGFVSSVLRVIDVDPDDYGTYICNAANALGSSYASVELFKTDDPVCPPACNVRPIKVKFGSVSNSTS